MSRKNIFEISQEKQDIHGECERIINLFLQRSFPSDINKFDYTIEDFANRNAFLEWSQRTPYLSCQDMRKDLGIDFEKGISDTASIDDIICILEYCVNILHLVRYNKYYGINESFSPYSALQGNIDTLLAHLNYERSFLDKDKIILIPKNPAMTAVAEISTGETAMSIFIYHHASLKGELEKKRGLLVNIAREYEDLLKSSVDGFQEFYRVANQVLNNFHIRHNNKDPNSKNTKIDLSDDELEELYDDLYQLLLFCVLIKDNCERKAKLSEFLKNFKEH